ncbi:HS12A-like protein [Mya arenaria]|uniref:HS12A-like protein n=1 Tax=Mya arenaria TaxID=6604 RepID=A0ABY7FZB3_MYAAR|nr:HS12A-like protein [Mya arenaria]
MADNSQPEAASIFCRLLPVEQSGGEYSLSTFTGGTKFLVVDAGGGTVDIAVQQVTETGLIKNIHVASGGDWGGSKVDEEFFKFITNIIGDKAFEVFKNTCREDFTFLTGDFEIKKRTVTLSTDTVVFRLSSSLSSTVLECTGKTLQTLIEESIYAGKVVFVTEEGCQLAGKLRLPLAGSGLDRNVKVEMIYGETEIKVEAKEIATGKFIHK